jgi:hypothetical protein
MTKAFLQGFYKQAGAEKTAVIGTLAGNVAKGAVGLVKQVFRNKLTTIGGLATGYDLAQGFGQGVKQVGR